MKHKKPFRPMVAASKGFQTGFDRALVCLATGNNAKPAACITIFALFYGVQKFRVFCISGDAVPDPASLVLMFPADFDFARAGTAFLVVLDPLPLHLFFLTGLAHHRACCFWTYLNLTVA